MTNEELAVAIQDGQTDLMPTLLEQNKGLLEKLAWKKANSNHDNIADFEDFLQAGYIALMRAVDYYDRDQEFPLTAYLKNTLKTEYRLAAGMHLQRKNPFDPCASAYSTDAPVSADDPDGSTFGDTIPDPDSEIPFEEVEERSMHEHIRETLDAVADDVLDPKRREVYNGLLMELRCSDMARIDAVSRERMRQRKEDMLEALRGDPRILQLWLDVTEQNTTVQDIADHYMRCVGVGSFREYGQSSVERAVMDIIKSEGIARKKWQSLENAVERKLHAAMKLEEQQKRKAQRQQISDELAAFERGRSERLAGGA